MTAKKAIRTLSCEEMQRTTGGLGKTGELPTMRQLHKRTARRNRVLKGRK
ncbi:MAG: hypothetical protein U1E76_02925 [Planctomycetota bacterium]